MPCNLFAEDIFLRGLCPIASFAILAFAFDVDIGR